MEENHYYPFGLPMDDVVLTEGTLHDNIRYKYQGNEFTKELGLHWMDFHARQYDPQLGRFLGIDPLADAYGQHVYSPYSAMGNAPSQNIDPNGESFHDMFMPAHAGVQQDPSNGWRKGTIGDLAGRGNHGSDDDRLMGLYRMDGPGPGGGIGNEGKAKKVIGGALNDFGVYETYNVFSNYVRDLNRAWSNGDQIVVTSIGEIGDDNYEQTVTLIRKRYQQSNGGNGLDATIKTTGVVNDALGAAYSTTEAIAGGGIILTNKLNKASNLMNGVKIIKKVPAIGVVGTVSDALDVGLDVYNGDYGKAVLKGGVLILKNTIRFSSPVGFAVITLIDLGISAYDLYNDVNDD